MADNNNNIEKLDLFTVQHENIPYSLIHTGVIQTIEDHFAGIIWVYLQTLPVDWVVNKSHLQQKFKIGEDKIKKHMAYLHRTNLIEYIRYRDCKGQLSPVIVRVLNGTRFSPQALKSTGVKITPVDLPTGVIFHPVVSTGVKTTPVVESSPERFLSTGVKNHTSGYSPPFTKEEEEEVKTSTSSFFNDLQIQRILRTRSEAQNLTEMPNIEFLTICEIHVKTETPKNKNFNKAQRIAGLCKMIAAGDFEPPQSYVNEKEEAKKKIEQENRLKAQQEAQERQHRERAANEAAKQAQAKENPTTERKNAPFKLADIIKGKI